MQAVNKIHRYRKSIRDLSTMKAAKNDSLLKGDMSLDNLKTGGLVKTNIKQYLEEMNHNASCTGCAHCMKQK